MSIKMRLQAALLAAGLLWACPALAQTVADDTARAIATDPPLDAAHPASTLAIEIPSHGAMMNALIYRPGGAGPFPLVILMHGLPGNEQNLDLAQALRRAGWAVLTFHYRGCFGSQGRFSIDNAMEDARVVSALAETTAAARAWNINPHRIAVIGHSMGGLAAARSAASDPHRLATVLIAPWDPSTLARLLRPMSIAQRNAAAEDRWGDAGSSRLAGTSSRRIAAEIVDHGERWRLSDAAEGIAYRPLLIVTATRDLPSSRADELKAVLTRRGVRFIAREIASDHVFDDRRIELETLVVGWLARIQHPEAGPDPLF